MTARRAARPARRPAVLLASAALLATAVGTASLTHAASDAYRGGFLVGQYAFDRKAERQADVPLLGTLFAARQADDRVPFAADVPLVGTVFGAMQANQRRQSQAAELVADEAQVARQRANDDRAALEAQLAQLEQEMIARQDAVERNRDARASLEERLRAARLDGEAEDRLQILQRELAATQAEGEKLSAEYRDLATRIAQVRQRMEEARTDAERAAQEEERRDRIAALEAVRASGSQAEAEVTAVLERARALVGEADAAVALRAAIGQSEIDRLTAQYTAQKQRAAQVAKLAEMGAVQATEAVEAKMHADMALAELREVELRRLLEQVEREREGFGERQGQPGERTAEDVAHVLQAEFFRGYLGLVNEYSQLTADPERAAVAAVVTAADLLREQEPQKTIDYFQGLLRETPYPSVRRAVRLQLVDAYRAANDTEGALEQLRALMTASDEGARSRRAEEAEGDGE